MNWTLLIQNLKTSGMTQREIAAVCGCTGANIRALQVREAQQPSYPLGMSLIALHKKRIGRAA